MRSHPTVLCIASLVLCASLSLAAEEKAGKDRGGRHRLQPPQPPPAEKTAYLGVATSPITDAMGAQLDLPHGVGLLVDFVDTNSPANGKLLQHDILHKLNDQLLVDQHQLAVLVRTFKPGEKVTLTVLRKGKSMQVTADLAEKDMPRLDQQSWHMPPIQFMPPIGMQPDRMHDQMEDLLNDSGLAKDKIRELMEKMERSFSGDPAAGGMQPGPQPQSQIRMSVQGSASSTITKMDNEHNMTLTVDGNGNRNLSVTSRDGKAVFNGPVNTDEEIEKVPKELREKMPELKDQVEAPVIKMPGSPDAPVF